MKRLQIYIEEELDEALAVEAARTKTSKAALIREYVAERLGRTGGRSGTFDEVAAISDAEPADIDEIVYGR
jgi:Ribbon-helix-helix protein, copG family